MPQDYLELPVHMACPCLKRWVEAGGLIENTQRHGGGTCSLRREKRKTSPSLVKTNMLPFYLSMSIRDKNDLMMTEY